MKRLSVVALAAVGFALPVCAQRSAAHGSFSAHSATAFRGGFATSTPRSFAGAPRYTGLSPLSSIPRLPGSSARNSVSRPNYYYGPGRYRRPYPARYGYGVPYLGAAWIAPDYLAYPDTPSYDDSDAAPNYAAGYDGPPPDQDEPAPAPVYSPYVSPYIEAPHVPASFAKEDAVTLIFKDGRPPQQIRNYAMTRTMLYVRDEHHRDIPLDQLDFDATQRVNHAAGVDFQLPELSR
jgi:hypothetical protein